MAEILANKLIGLLVTVGVLAAVYFFAIKPILDTTNDTIDRAFQPFENVQDDIQQSFDDAGLDGFDVNSIDVNGSKKKADRLLDCIQRVQPHTATRQTCVDRFGS